MIAPTRVLVIHKGAGQFVQLGGRKFRRPASYQVVTQVRNLVLYALAPARQSKGKERVAAVVVGGLGINLAPGEILLPNQADFLTRVLVDDVPGDRRLIRHVVLSLAGKEAYADQVTKCQALIRRFADRYAPGYAYVGIVHDDHFSEDGRGVHAHVFFRNSDATGRALDWSRDDLRAQQSLIWAGDIHGVEPTRGTGPSPPKTTKMPYPKSKRLDANHLASLNENEIESLLASGQLSVGRRNKDGRVASVILNGRRIRLSTIRDIATRKKRLGSSWPGAVGSLSRRGDNRAGNQRLPAFDFHRIQRGVVRLGTRRRRRNAGIQGTHSRGRGLSAVARGGATAVKMLSRTLEGIDKIGRILR